MKRKKKGKQELVGYVVCNNHVKALCDLYLQQEVSSPSVNPRLKIRTPEVKQILKMMQRNEMKKRKADLAYRGVGTNLDGYNEHEQMRMIQHYVGMNSVAGFRSLADHLIGKATLLRGMERRNIELADIFKVDMNEVEGATPCSAMVILMNNGKTNEVGRMEYGAALRHRNPKKCAIGATLLYIFARWNSCFPDTLNKEEFYNLKLFHSDKDVTKAISYQSHYKMTKKCLRKCGIQSSKVTHMERGSFVRNNELSATSENQLRRLGRWNQDSLNTSYLTNLPLEAMRASSGFSPSGKSYYLPRAENEPPRSLIDAVFKAAKEQKRMLQETDVCDLSTAGFLEFLLWGRTVLLQDLPFLDIPENSIIFERYPFNTGEYKDWERFMRTSVHTNGEVELNLLTQRCLPEIQDQLRSNALQIMRNNQLIVEANKRSQEMFSSLMRVLKRPYTESRTGNDNEENVQRISPSNSDTIIQECPNFQMSRNLKTVYEVWMEWDKGIHGPSVRSLEEKYGRKWRSLPKESKYFSNRKVIVDEILRKSRGTNVSMALQELETIRLNAGNKSLNWLRNYILKTNKV